MLKQFLLRVLSSDQQLTTYSVGLLQAKAYRVLKQKTHEILKPYTLSSLDWALLGLLYDEENGYKLIELSKLLGIEPPFASILVRDLEKRQLVERTQSLTDKRAKVIRLTLEGRHLVPEVETHLKQQMKYLLTGINLPSVYMYMNVLAGIIRNGEVDNNK